VQEINPIQLDKTGVSLSSFLENYILGCLLEANCADTW